MTITDVFTIKGRGIVVCVDNPPKKPVHVGEQLRRRADGATWTLTGVESGRSRGICLRGDVMPEVGDVLEPVS